MTIVGFGRARFAALVMVATTTGAAVQTGPCTAGAISPGGPPEYNLIARSRGMQQAGQPEQSLFVIASWTRAMCSATIMDGPSSSQHVTIHSSAAETSRRNRRVRHVDGSKPVTVCGG